tara:strand:- start:5697 stop:6428 length:732 start_codon:yes stop_codon:yes gene_type:complete
MSSTISNATLTVSHTESIVLNGTEQGATNTLTIANIDEVSKRIISVPQSEIVIASFSTAIAQGTFVEGDVRYIRITNKDDANFTYLVFKNEYNNEFCIKLDYGQSFIYNGDHTSGVIDTMLANQVALGFDETTGDKNSDDDITSITATNKIIPGLRVSHTGGSEIPAGTSVGAITGGDSTDGYRGTAHTMVTRNATTGGETASNATGGTDNLQTYASGFGDLVEITAEADTASVDLEVFIASK